MTADSRATFGVKDAPLSVPRLFDDDRARRACDVFGFTPHVTVFESLEEMLPSIQADGRMDFNHPRYYNIAWMTLLDERHPNPAKVPNVV